jgi:NAD(P)-dependent dehydrogenase (short-subunit alcohol dehydrogenase family)
MGQDLEGKVAMVTGGAKGIGRAICELFVQEGARVLIADLDEAAGMDLAGRMGDAVLFRKMDVAQTDEIRETVEMAVEHFGGLNVMVNNAAISSALHPRFLDEKLSDFDRVMRVNLLGVMVGTQCAARHMSAHSGGSIINLSSTSGLTAGFGVISYRVAKAGVVQLTRSAAIDLAEYGIRVNGIAPGNISTDMNAFTAPGMNDDALARWRNKLDAVRLANQPLKRKGKPEDVAQAALYLAGARSEQVTGVIIPVDGGVTAGDPINHLKAIMDARATLAAAVDHTHHRE